MTSPAELQELFSLRFSYWIEQIDTKENGATEKNLSPAKPFLRDLRNLMRGIYDNDKPVQVSKKFPEKKFSYLKDIFKLYQHIILMTINSVTNKENPSLDDIKNAKWENYQVPQPLPEKLFAPQYTVEDKYLMFGIKCLLFRASIANSDSKLSPIPASTQQLYKEKFRNWLETILASDSAEFFKIQLRRLAVQTNFKGGYVQTLSHFADWLRDTIKLRPEDLADSNALVTKVNSIVTFLPQIDDILKLQMDAPFSKDRINIDWKNTLAKLPFDIKLEKQAASKKQANKTSDYELALVPIARMLKTMDYAKSQEDLTIDANKIGIKSLEEIITEKDRERAKAVLEQLDAQFLDQIREPLLKMQLFGGSLELEIKKFESEKSNYAFKFDEPEVNLFKGMEMCVIIDNLPVTDESKVERLKGVILKQLEKPSTTTETKMIVEKQAIAHFDMPLGKDKNTKGFAFMELTSQDIAKVVVQKLNGYNIDKLHSLRVSPLNDLENYEKFDENKWEEYKPKPFISRENLFTWLTDKNARDQYAIRYYDTVEVGWNDTMSKFESVAERKDWVADKKEERMLWSPLGSYLVTWTKKAITLWGGEEFDNQGTFQLKNVHSMDFSPKERYLITATDEKSNNVIIWDTKTMTAQKEFTVPLSVFETHGEWPMFKWSPDEKYYARRISSGIQVYEAATHKMKLIEATGCQEFSWSPTDNIIAYWVPGKDPVPAKVALIEYPSMKTLTFKNVFNVSKVALFWNKSGNYLAAQVDRKGVKKADITNFELFRMRQKNIPVETIEVSEAITEFAWEPYGDMFIIIHSNDAHDKNISFYVMKNDSAKKLKTLEKRPIDRVFWSSQGRFVVMTNTHSITGVLEFWDAHDIEMIGYGEHFMMTDLQWDPSGRYVCSSVSHYARPNENGFTVWNMLGRMIHSARNERFWQFYWRPRPPTLLSKQQEKKILQSLSEKKKQFQDEERVAVQKAQEEIQNQRKQAWQEFMDFKARLQKEYDEDKAARAALRGEPLEEQPLQTEVYFEEELVEEKEEELTE